MRDTDKEIAFAELVRDYENQWVAILEKDGAESIVGSGSTAVAAAKEASENGHPHAMLFKVPSFKARLIFGDQNKLGVVPIS